MEPVTEVKVDDDLIAFLAEHYPSALEESRRVQPAWVSDIDGRTERQGYYVTITGEKLTEVPGIDVPEPDPPAPRVTLSEDAEQHHRGRLAGRGHPHGRPAGPAGR